MRNFILKFAVITFIFYLNCDNSPIGTNEIQIKKITGIWYCVKYEEANTDYDAGFIVNNKKSTEYFKDTIESIYLFGDGQCTNYYISGSYTDTGSGEYDYLTNRCYQRDGYTFYASENMITGDTGDKNWNYNTNKSFSVDWGSSTSDSCSETFFTKYKFKNDTLILTYTSEIKCPDNRSTIATWEDYYLPYSGIIPPSNWPQACDY